MTCEEAEILLHALIDGELDGGRARDVEAHLVTCSACTEKLESLGAMREAMTAAHLKVAAPEHLRHRIEAAIATPMMSTARANKSRFESWREFGARSWRSFFGGFAIGTALSAAVAATLVVAVIRDDRTERMTGEIVSAHLRSLQASHLTDVETSDQHTVKPWFNGKLDAAPPVVDLAAQGFTLIGGRLDAIDGKSVAAIVYKRHNHVINLFVAPRSVAAPGTADAETMQGFNVRHWTQTGLDCWAVSDINAQELAEFSQKLAAALRPAAGID